MGGPRAACYEPAMTALPIMAARSAFLCSALIMAFACPASAAPPQPAGKPTVLHLSQTAERQLPRDLLHVEMRAENAAGDPQLVQAAINRVMARILPELRQVNGIEVETGTYTVHRVTPEHGPAEWRGIQTLTLSGTDFGLLLNLAGRLQSEGLVMSNLVYEASPKTVRGAEDELTAAALSALGRRAAEIAQQLHLTVTGYRDLTVGNAEPGGPPTPRFAAVGAAMAAPAPVGAAGKATVRVTVNAEILLAAQGP